MALARGLDALLGDNNSGSETLTLRLTQIEPNKEQPRKTFDDEKLNELAASIKEHGLIQPIVVSPSTNGTTYRIIAGERRFRASRIAGLREVPVKVLDVDEAEIKKIGLVENIQREDLNPVEESMAIKQLLDEYDIKQEDLAKTIGKSRSYISNSVRLLNLPETVLEKLSEGKISTGHAKALLGLNDPKNIEPALKEIISRELNVRQTEKLVELLNSSENGNEDDTPKKTRNVYFTETELSLKEKLGRNVTIRGKGGKGTITFEFFSEDDLTQIANQLADSLGNP